MTHPRQSNAALPGGAQGSPKPPCVDVMSAYDTLLPDIRRVVAQAAFDWDVCAILRLLRERRVTVSQIVRRIAEVERASSPP